MKYNFFKRVCKLRGESTKDKVDHRKIKLHTYKIQNSYLCILNDLKV